MRDLATETSTQTQKGWVGNFSGESGQRKEIMKQFIGRSIDVEDAYGNYVFAMSLDEIHEKPTQKEDCITNSIPASEFPVYTDKGRTAWCTLGYVQENIKYLI